MNLFLWLKKKNKQKKLVFIDGLIYHYLGVTDNINKNIDQMWFRERYMKSINVSAWNEISIVMF